MNRKQSTSAMLAVVLALWAQPPISAQEVGKAGPGLSLESCHLSGYRQEVECGSLTVYENRASAEGRQIEIQFAVLPAIDEASEPDPLVFFAGGPGQAALEVAPFVRAIFSEVNERRDLVLIDQRGMGSSAPLKCDMPEEEGLMLNAEQRRELSREMVSKCLQELEADVTLYTQDLANQDAHQILKGLGYEKVNLYGVSWGTRSALLYAHQFPEHVRTLILDGSLPLENAAPSHAAEDAERAMVALFDDCRADADCSKAFPELRQDFERVAERLGDGLEISLPDPSTGEPLTLLLNRDAFGDMLRSILYSPELSRLAPIIIHRAAAGDFRPLMGVGGFVTGATADSMTLGATLTIFCSEELARFTAEDLDRQETARLLGYQFLENLQTACEVWPKAPIPAIYQQEIRVDAPALILSGDLDPITPPRWGERMTEHLPNSKHFVAPATGHNVGPEGCASDLMRDFIEQGSLEEIDGECLQDIRRPSFFVDLSGPSPGPSAPTEEPRDEEPQPDATTQPDATQVNEEASR